MLLMNLLIKLCNALVISVSIIKFSIYTINYITVILRTIAKSLQIYFCGILIRATLFALVTRPVYI